MNQDDITNQLLQIASMDTQVQDKLNLATDFMNNSGLSEHAQSEILGLLSQNLPIDLLTNNITDIIANNFGGEGIVETATTAMEGFDMINSIGDFFGGESSGE